MLGVVRALCRGLLRAWIKWAPATGRPAALRLPFSRFHRWLPRLFGGRVLADWRGARLAVNPGETAGYYLYFFPFDAEPELEWLAQECASATSFLDVGANIGSVSLALAAKYPRLRVWAVEPDRGLAQTLRDNVALNPGAHGRVTVLETAVGANSGTAWFEPAGDANRLVGHVAGTVVNRTSDVYAVPIVTLRDMFATIGVVPDVVKIDIEGHELAALEGLRDAPRLPRALAIELHPFTCRGDERLQFTRAIAELLEAFGYESRYLINESNWISRPPVEPWPDRLHVFATLRTSAASSR